MLDYFPNLLHEMTKTFRVYPFAALEIDSVLLAELATIAVPKKKP
jgi:hypothetical protein|tara:strand:- start:680 stop:814 length:135 start_codon:yes stop_codon:yes gene_type:complete